MKLETILQILYANKMDNVISLAIQIDNNIPFETNVGDEIMIEVRNTDLPEGKVFNKGKSWGYTTAVIQAVNRYSIEAPYLVTLPNGKTRWVGIRDRTYTGDVVEITDMPQATALAE